VIASIRTKCIGEGPESFHDLRSVPKAGRLREQVENRQRTCTRVLFLRKAELRFFHFLEIVTGSSEDPSTTWLVPSTAAACCKQVSSAGGS